MWFASWVSYRAFGDSIFLQHGKAHVWVILKMPASQYNTAVKKLGRQVPTVSCYLKSMQDPKDQINKRQEVTASFADGAGAEKSSLLESNKYAA